ncbi:MAG: hypothetical protein RL367_1432 [Pseudomonadota bacterium]
MALRFVISVVALAWCAPAVAQVYELGDDGSYNVREGGGAVTWRDANAPPPVALAPAAAVKLTLVTAALAPATYQAALQQSAARHAISPALLEALVWQESRWQPGAVSPKGAVGLTQLMPATAVALGVDPRDPIANLDGGARYLRLMIDHFGGDLVKGLAAYNAGVLRVERAGGIPAIRETQNYVASIMARLSAQGGGQ